VFATFDRDHDGRITVADLLNVSSRLGLPTNAQDLGILLGTNDIHGELSRARTCIWQVVEIGLRGLPLGTIAAGEMVQKLKVDKFIGRILGQA
jgi:hypothetical protein